MYDQVKYNSVKGLVFLAAIDMIPMIRDGKGDIDALTSFMNDMRMWKRFRLTYDFAENKTECVQLIDSWNKYMQLRNSEDFIPHNKSLNRGFYSEIF